MKSYDFDAVTFDSEVRCVGCLPDSQELIATFNALGLPEAV